MDGPELSPEQDRALARHIRLVEACPGAGKTRTIVARFRQQATATKQAVALLSFTNSAINEAAKRCADDATLRHPPNFVGTLDSFLHRYVVSPWFLRSRGMRPSYVESWDDLPDKMNPFVRHRDVAGKGLHLSSFQVGVDGQLRYPNDPPSVDRAYLAQLASGGITTQQMTTLARTKIASYLDSGLHDCDQARVRALRILEFGDSVWPVSALANRFEEVIIDEFQDCSAIEHSIVSTMEAAGIRVVVVADPDQGIYEFRQASPAAYGEYRGKFSSHEVLTLSENFRSSPAICSLLTVLRSVGSAGIVSRAHTPEHGFADSVHIVSGAPPYIRDKFSVLADSLEICEDQRLVLAATRSGAAALAGASRTDRATTTNSGKILGAISVLRTSPNATARKQAVDVIERFLIESLAQSDQFRNNSFGDVVERLGIERVSLRIIVGALLEVSQTWVNETEALVSLRAEMSNHLKSLNAGPAVTMGHRLRKFKSEDWTHWIKCTQGEAAQVRVLSTSHIHAVKGLEFEAVLLEIERRPSGNRPHVLEDWAANRTSEARRVLYVGASRAKRLLVLATPPTQLATLRQILEGTEVPIAIDVQSL